jgi:hypothetical protein
MGGTNVVEYAPGQGLVWWLKKDRGGSGCHCIVGAGVATVTADASGARATRVGTGVMWNGGNEPYFGDVGVTYNPRDGKVYGYGPAASSVFLARATATRATDVNAYEYWDQTRRAWQTQRLNNPTNAQALFANRELGQSNAFWSNYYNTWMFVAGANVGYTDIMVMTAPNLEGPWTKAFTVASTCPNNQCSAVRYAIEPHPEYDPSGRTLLVTWTDSNVIYSARLHWR